MIASFKISDFAGEALHTSTSFLRGLRHNWQMFYVRIRVLSLGKPSVLAMSKFTMKSNTLSVDPTTQRIIKSGDIILLKVNNSPRSEPIITQVLGFYAASRAIHVLYASVALTTTFLKSVRTSYIDFYFF